MPNEEKDLFADLKIGDVRYFYFQDKTAHTGERIFRVVRDGSGTLWTDNHGVGIRVSELAEPVICEVPHSTVFGTGHDQGLKEETATKCKH